MDPHYQPHSIIGLPTSATRGSWQPPPPPPWSDGQMYHVPYYQSPYYRPPPGMVTHTQHPPASQMKHEFIIQGPSQMQNGAPSTQTCPGSPKPSRVCGQEESKSTSTPAPVIDPTLDGKSDTSAAKDAKDDHPQPKSVSLEITEAAVQAVIESAKRREKEEEDASAARSKHVKEDGADDVEADTEGHDHENDHEDDSSDSSESAAHQMILAELLTQESLASPPPS